jgi:hypothetical protein
MKYLILLLILFTVLISICIPLLIFMIFKQNQQLVLFTAEV